jgi:hypothetical protein
MNKLRLIPSIDLSLEVHWILSKSVAFSSFSEAKRVNDELEWTAMVIHTIYDVLVIHKVRVDSIAKIRVPPTKGSTTEDWCSSVI